MESIASLILTILALLVLIIFIGSLYAFFFAIFQFIFSAGDAEKVKKGWNSIRYMALGIIFTLSVLFLFPIILKRARIPGYEYYTANNIFAQVSIITGGLLKLGREAATTYQSGTTANPNLPNDSDAPSPGSAGNPGSYQDLEL